MKLPCRHPMLLKFSLRAASSLPVLVFTFLLGASLASAQNSSDKGTPAESKTGQSTASTYARDKIETVNLANGNFSLSIPLATIGGRGSASYTLALAYNSKVWSAQHDVADPGLIGGEDPPPEVPWDLNTAVYEKLEEGEPGLAKLGGGWTLRMAPGIKALTFGVNPWTVSGCSLQSGDPPTCGYKYALTKMWLTLPDGSQVELRDKNTQGTPAISPVSNGYHQLIDRDRGRVWRSIDGSGVIFVRDAGYPVGQIGGPGLHFPSGWVFLPDGTRMRMVDGAATKIIDRNGNFIDIGGSGYTDQLGRQTLVEFGVNLLTVTVKGYGGTPDRSLSIQFGVLGSNLRSDFQLLPRPFTTGDAFRDSQGNYTEHTITEPHTDLFVHSEGFKHYGSTTGDDVGAKTGVTQMNLLDGRSLRFRYNQYGEVAEIVYPGGGISQIDYNGTGSGVCEVSGPMGATFNRQVSQRRTLTDGANVDATWVYGKGAAWLDGVYYPTVAVSVYQGAETGTLLSQEVHYFLKLGAEYRQCGSGNGTGNEKWDNAKEFRTDTQTGTGTTIVSRHWDQRTPLVWVNDGNNGYLFLHGQDQAPNDPRILWEETTLENGKMKRTEYGYDQFNNITSIKEYDFGTAGSPGTLLRETIRTYATEINGNCYSNLNPADPNCGTGLANEVASIIYQPRLLLEETIKDGEDNEKSFSKFEYDNYTGEPNHHSIIPNEDMIHYDVTQFATFQSTTQPRGNATKVTRRLTGGADVVSYSKYDNAGHVIWSKDPNGNETNYSYADNFGSGENPAAGAIGAAGPTFAMLSLTTNPLGHQTKMQYNFSLGAASGIQDANGSITKSEFDNLGRTVRTIAALNQAEQIIAEMTYPTAAANAAKVSKQLDATRWLSSKTWFDGFDRPSLAGKSEDGLHYNSATYTIFSKIVYDALGRVKLSSNPYRSIPATTDGWTRTTFDLGGRVTEVATFAGVVDNQPPDTGTNSNWTGSIVTLYESDVTTITDQAQKKRRSVSDALGRLIKVYEDPEGANYLTTYSYDALDNLTGVSQVDSTTQFNQTRSFGYDSLKRLTSATNPEGGTITYEYDNNGNITKKIDPRLLADNQTHVSITYQYDALNRVKIRTYNNGTPMVTNTYDTTASGKGRLASVSSSVSTYNYNEYDAMDRARNASQTLGGHVYIMNYGYDLAGNVTSIGYPSGYQVNYTFDNAGRPNSFRGNLGEGGGARDYATGIIYNALGSMTSEQLGTATPIYNKLLYNVRGQLAEIRVGTNPGDTGFERGAIINDYSLNYNCWGASCMAPDNNGNLLKQSIYLPGNDRFSTQWYVYDGLNRLELVKETDHVYATGQSHDLWQQKYAYDRYGNRTINYNLTSPGIPRPQFTVNTSTNRLGVPGGQSGTMTYDSAGNLTVDNYSAAAITRAFDAENRMTSETQANNVASYTYDGEGRRVKRVAGGVETRQVYGIGGELLAEYAATSPSPATPQKEYGYRSGILLITASAGTIGWGAPPSFTPPATLISGGEIKLEHLTELRIAVNQLRSHAGLPAATFTVDPNPERYVTTVKADHILQLRTALEAARLELGLSTGGYAHPGLHATDFIYPIDFQELRNQILSAWNEGGSGPDIRWLVSDQLGTPRMTFDLSGSLAATTRHDYLPFGEELFAGTGGRSTSQGYSVPAMPSSADGARQKFTSKERDNETGLDYFVARYYSSTQGRFISPDPLSIILLRQNSPKDDKSAAAFTQFIGDPRRWNRFAYSINSPVVFTDKTGLDIMIIENGPTSGNPIGHTAIAITGRGVYSMGNGQSEKQKDAKNNILGGGVKDYLMREAPRRDTTLTIIKTTPAQDRAIAAQLENTAKTGGQLNVQGIASDNCSTRVNAALDAGGIMQGGDGTPGSAGKRAMMDGGVNGDPQVIEVPQNSTGFLSKDMKLINSFEPKPPAPNIPPPGAPGGTPVETMKMKTKKGP